MARRCLALALVTLLLLALGASAASAEPRWLVRRFDARDLPFDPGCGVYPCLGWDIRTVTLKVRDAGNGRAYLTITLRSYTPQGGFASGVQLDTRGGPGADFRAYLDQSRLAEEMPGGPGPATCGVRRARPDADFRMGAFRHFHDGSVATCRVPLAWVRPTRAIRWHVWTEDLFPQPYRTLDVAPDGRWWSG